MSFEQLVEDHHKMTYSGNVEMVAQQKQNRLRPAVTMMPATGQSMSVADLLGTTEYEEGEDRSRRNPEIPPARTRRGLIRPPVIQHGQYLDTEDKFDMAMDPTSPLMQNSVVSVERGVFDRILGIRPKSGGGFEVSGTGILGKATEGKRLTSNVSLPSEQYEAANSTGLTLDKLRDTVKNLQLDEFGIEDDDQLYGAITPNQQDNLLAIAAATQTSLNAFSLEQLQTGKPTTLLGINWILTNRLPTDSSNNRLIPIWSKKNIIAGVWQDVKGQIWNDTHAKNLPYIYTSAYVDVVRKQDKGVRVIRCVES